MCLQGEQWWQTLDEPWQGLATCMELKAAYDSGDPVNYVSHTPVHQVSYLFIHLRYL